MSDEHEPRWRGTGYGGGRMVCRCGDDCEDGYNAHVEPVVAERIAQARREGAAEAWDEGWHAAAQVVDLEGRPVWAHTVMPEGYEGNPYATALRGDA